MRILSHIRSNIVGYVPVSLALIRKTALGALVVALIALLAWTVPAEGAEKGKSAATITATFAESCTDFEAHSSKDISHVEIHYADGAVVKDENIDSPDLSIAG